MYIYVVSILVVLQSFFTDLGCFQMTNRAVMTELNENYAACSQQEQTFHPLQCTVGQFWFNEEHSKSNQSVQSLAWPLSCM